MALEPDVQILVNAVMAHAIEHYEEDGWDYIVESYTYEELAKEIEGATTERGAIRKAHALVKLLDERRRDIESTAW